ncbi:MAG: S8 family serine peptidase, partial [Flavobacteriales bacterium]|nr:S8 family serine peptidase [Flavobacteriales bacterium]
MKKLLLILFYLPMMGFGQQTYIKNILLKSGKIHLDTKFNISPKIKEIVHGNYYRYIQFSEIPSEEQKNILVKDGVKFLEYIPVNTYVVSVSTSFSDIDKLREFGAISLQNILPEQKIDPKLHNGKCPEWALDKNIASIKVLFYKNVNMDFISYDISKNRYSIIEMNARAHYIVLDVPIEKIEQVSQLPYVSFIEPIDPPSEKENKTGRTLHRSNTINTNYASGRHYNGEGINIMMQDDGLVGPHIDRQGRIDQSFCVGCSSSSSNDHGDHVSGTIMGAGNLDPLGKGMADGAFLYVYSSSNNNYYNVPTIYQNNDVTITSKSYSNGCNAGYTSLARDLDEQINLYPSLIHVFSAGNSGSSNCSYGAGSGWGNVTGGHKQAKNVITVANLSLTGSLANSSSRGPAHDGRIKPDIGAKGTSVYSPVSPYAYATYTGTSMACPGIAGVMAQLYQVYKDLNAGQNPSSALMKCLMLNSADDIGNSGPDFKHGWGEVNAYRAVKILENNQYFSSSVAQSGNNYHNITVPSGTKKIKVMVYWHDKEASANSSIALVNDINITLTSPTLSTYNPWVLDYTPNINNLDQPAIRGIDDRNNMEQVTITNLSSGSYTLNINGFAIPYGPQEYWVTYEFLTDDIQLTYPVGGEGLVPGESEYIRWDAHGTLGNFTLEYSTNSGANWSSITTSASGSSRHYIWTVPNNITANTLIRVSRNGYSDQSDATFTVINVPQNVSVNWICPDSIYVSWSAVSGATSYEVSMLGQKYMDSMTTTNNLTALMANPNPSITDSWFSVCAKVNNGKGRRAVAVNAQPLNPGCVGYGCTDPNAYNYDPTAIYDNGTCIYCNANLPYSENFDNGLGTWTNTGYAGNWTLSSGGTPSNNTGPTDDVTSGGNYMYIEASSPNYPYIGPFTLTSECFDISNSTSPILSFFYNMYGSAMGTLNVYANNSLIWTLSGNQGQGWNLVQIPLTSVGNILVIDFEGTTGSSWASDIAIDNISITNQNLIPGCTDPMAINYDSIATINDGSCLYPPTIFCDDFDSYSNAAYLTQSSSDWTTWSGTGSGTTEDVQITNSLSISPSNSIYFNGQSGGGPSDIVLPFGSFTPYTSGYFDFSANFFVNLGTGAYFNFQAENFTGTTWSLDVHMDNLGNVSFENGGGATVFLTSTYPMNVWFEVRIAVDLTNNNWEIFIDGVSQGSFSNTINKIASLDLYPLAGHQFYVDDVCYTYSTTPINTSGCTDPLACNYDPLANIDDGSCAYPSSSTDSQVHCDAYIWIDGNTYTSSNNTATWITTNAAGCIHVVTLDLTINYSTSSNTTITVNNSYSWNGVIYTVSGTYFYSIINSFGCDSTAILYLTINTVISGCIDSTATNYDPLATVDDGSCVYCVYGCTDSVSVNYNASATCDDGSCIAPVYGCMDPLAT